MALVTKTGSPFVDKALRSLEGSVNQLDRLGVTKGVLVEGAITAGTPRRFVHGLQRPFRGWLVVRKDANSNVFETSTSSTDHASEVWLDASANVNVTVLVF